MYIHILVRKLICLYRGLHKNSRDGVEDNSFGLLFRCRSAIIFVYTCTYVCMNVYIYMYICILICKLICSYIGLHQDGGDGVDENISLPLCNYVYILMYIYMYICIYIHVYIYTDM